ncbi:MAG: hypothetical protein R3B84_07910 [Zavarzinella sp.]
MANIYQQAVSRRKLYYLAGMFILFVCTLLVRGTIRVPMGEAGDAIYSKTIDGQAEYLELTELSQGDTRLSGAAINLLLTGTRGIVVCGLWNYAMEKAKKHEWNELDTTVKSITTLQPHFTSPWLFQSWNIAYNVSVEMDSLDDMYYYIARGINILAEGEDQNRRNPDLRWNMGFYYQNKFSVSDKVTTLRCLYQMSCMTEEDRNSERLINPENGEINKQAFTEFCRKNPQLIRRLKESAIRMDRGEYKTLAESPLDVVDFLKRNRSIPSRYIKGSSELATRLKQFPVFPEYDPGHQVNELPWNVELRDHQSDAFCKKARLVYEIQQYCSSTKS